MEWLDQFWIGFAGAFIGAIIGGLIAAAPMWWMR